MKSHSARQFGDQLGKVSIGGDRVPEQVCQPETLPEQTEELPKDAGFARRLLSARLAEWKSDAEDPRDWS
jgi:hypothetical protein